jgi:hypothetical protein
VQPYLDYLERLAPYIALAAFLAVLVIVINWQGRKLERHAIWLARLDLRVGNLHKDREATRVRKLQHPIVPPPLPPRHPTVGAVDWEEELVDTEKLSRDTARYPSGKPPEDTNE